MPRGLQALETHSGAKRSGETRLIEYVSCLLVIHVVFHALPVEGNTNMPTAGGHGRQGKQKMFWFLCEAKGACECSNMIIRRHVSYTETLKTMHVKVIPHT